MSMIDAEEPVHQEVYRNAMQELLASDGWMYLEGRLQETRQRVIDSLIRASQEVSPCSTEVAVLGARIKAIEAFLELPLDMSKEVQESRPVPRNNQHPHGRRYMTSGRR